MSKSSGSIFHKTPTGNSSSSTGSRTPTSTRAKLTTKTRVGQRTPSKLTPGKDENALPFSTPKCETPLTSRSKTGSTTPGKSEYSRTNKTPLSSFNSRTAKSPSGKTVSSHSTVLTPGKKDRILVEFNDDILFTPKRLYDNCEPSVSVTSTSKVYIETPMKKKGSPFLSPLNRSHSTSSIVRNGKSQSDTPNVMKRYHSEARLSSESPSSVTSTAASDEGEISRVTVGVRVRPLHPREHGNSIFVKGNEIRVASDMNNVLRFTYDKCFASSGPDATSQEEVYNTLVKPLVDNAFEGYNASLFAYGQTGSGKTYSMMGHLEGGTEITKDTGIIPRFCHELISRVLGHDDTNSGDTNKPSSSNIEISYLEVYNEKIHDLLVPEPNTLKVREHPVTGPYVVNLTKKTVTTFEDFQHWLEIGNKKRATAATEMNDTSSRSHSLFTVILTQTFVQVEDEGKWSHDHTRRSQINLVDLAGSERIAHTSVSSDRLREGVSINRSLLTLGKVITALVEKRSFVPYRESVLTWLLKDSLGGNSRTTMLATVSPNSAHIEESVATLRYASQARSIVNTVRVNEAPQDKMIRELKEELERLKQEKNNDLECSKNINSPALENELKEANSELIKAKEELVFSKGMLGEATKKITDYGDQLKTLQDEKTKLLNTIKKMESEKVEFENNSKKYEEKYYDLVAKVDSEIEQKKLFMSSAELEIEKLMKDYNDLKNEYNSTKQKLEKSKCFEIQNEILRKDLDKNLELVPELQNQIKELKKSLAQVKNELKDSKKGSDRMKNLNEELNLKIDSLENSIEKLKESNQLYVSQLKEKNDQQIILEDNFHKISDENKRLQDGMKQLKESAEQVKELEVKINEAVSRNQNLLKDFDFKDDENKSLKEQLDKVLDQLKTSKEELTITKNENAKFFASIDENQRCIADLEEKIKTMNEQNQKLISDINFKSDENKILKQNHDKVSLDLKNISEQLSASQNFEKENKKLLKKNEILAQKLLKSGEECEMLSIKLNSINDLKKDSEALKEENQKLIEEISAQKSEIKILEEKLSKDEDYRLLNEKLENLISQRDNEIKTLEEKFSKNEEYRVLNEKLEQTISERDNKIKILEEELSRNSSEFKFVSEQRVTFGDHESKEILSLKAENEKLSSIIDAKTNEMNILEEELNKTSEELRQLTQKLKILKENSSRSDKEREMKYESLKTHNNKLQSLIEEIKNENKTLKEKLNKKKEKEKFFTKSLTDSLKEREKQEEDISLLKEQNLEFVSNLEKTLQDCMERNQQLSVDIEMKNAEKEILERNVNKTTDECRVLTKQLEDFKRNLSQLEADIESKEREVKKLTSKTNKRKTESELIKKLESSSEVMRNQIILLETQLQKEKAEKIKLEQENNLLNLQIKEKPDTFQKKDKARQQKEWDKANSKLKEKEEICENLKRDLENKDKYIANVEAQLKSLNDEKLTLIKAMEKQFSDSFVHDSQPTLRENNRLKRDLNILEQRLENKMKKNESLKEKLNKFEDIIKLILEEKISLKKQQAMLENKERKSYDFVMNLSFPHHIEHLTRKARRFVELYQIPYEFEIIEKDLVLIKHLLLSAKAVLHHGEFNDWVEKIEENSKWDKTSDSELPWKVDFEEYYNDENEIPKIAPLQSADRPDSALALGTKRRLGPLDPVEWRKMLVRRHVKGIKEDSDVLLKYFPDSNDSGVYSVLTRIQAAVIRLEELTKNVIK